MERQVLEKYGSLAMEMGGTMSDGTVIAHEYEILGGGVGIASH